MGSILSLCEFFSTNASVEVAEDVRIFVVNSTKNRTFGPTN